MQGLSYFPELERVSVESVGPLQLSEWYWFAIAATFTAQLAASRDQYEINAVLRNFSRLQLALIPRSNPTLVIQSHRLPTLIRSHGSNTITVYGGHAEAVQLHVR